MDYTKSEITYDEYKKLFELSELLKCPFCGSEAKVVEAGGFERAWKVGCSTVFKDTGMPCPGNRNKQNVGLAYPTKEIAVTSWNKRA